MLAIPAVIILVAFIYLRPQEIVPALAAIPFLYIFLALAMFGLALDVRLGKNQFRLAPQATLGALFFGWCIVNYVLRVGGGGLPGMVVQVSIAYILYFLVAHGVQTFKGLITFAVSLFAICLTIAFVCVHQGMAPLGCAVMLGDSSAAGVRPDGRPCHNEDDCQLGDAEPGAEYVCEHMGAFGTTSTAGRVRYRGILQDPNETSLACGSVLPVAFALREYRSTMSRTLLLLVALVTIGICVVFTQSRGGQLVVAAVLGTYFVKKYGIKGLAMGGIMSAPLLLLGGRDDSQEGSADERVEVMAEGLQFIRQAPLTGIGWNQYSDWNSHGLTAHNSYLLAISELGPLGFILFTMVLYVSFKTLLTGMRRYADDPAARIAKVWGMALLAGFIGMCVGSFFLSFTYHNVLWIFIGLTGAYWSACSRHDPSFEVSLTARDVAYCVLMDIGLVLALNVFVRFKGH
jgi:hypothetical protein